MRSEIGLGGSEIGRNPTLDANIDTTFNLEDLHTTHVFKIASVWTINRDFAKC